ncbi:MAG: FtsW/RodA/SpoVE family cell cycle protein [Sodalis sp. (in: enterobacteria)]
MPSADIGIERSYTEFIFTAMGEKLGFIRILVLLAPYLALTLRVLVSATQTQNNFVRVIADGLILIFLFMCS